MAAQTSRLRKNAAQGQGPRWIQRSCSQATFSKKGASSDQSGEFGFRGLPKERVRLSYTLQIKSVVFLFDIAKTSLDARIE